MVTTLYAGILGLIYIALCAYVILGRFKYDVNLGDGDNGSMLKRVRVHGNFIEYTPIALFLIFLAEYEGAAESFIHIMGIALVIGRIAHPLGITFKVGPSVGRSGGMVLTFGVIIAASIYCIKSYFIY